MELSTFSCIPGRPSLAVSPSPAAATHPPAPLRSPAPSPRRGLDGRPCQCSTTYLTGSSERSLAATATSLLPPHKPRQRHRCHSPGRRRRRRRPTRSDQLNMGLCSLAVHVGLLISAHTQTANPQTAHTIMGRTLHSFWADKWAPLVWAATFGPYYGPNKIELCNVQFILVCSHVSFRKLGHVRTTD
uniref:Uncharacterized protein n=1 Tax=Oryza brachyantha TaxID=4533 RepID=J3NA60_ORYBR